MSGSGISWAICKSAPRSRQTTMPAHYRSVFLQAGCPSCRPTNSVKALKGTVSCFRKIQIGFTFLVPAHMGSPGQRAVRWVCVCDWLAIHKTRSDDATYLSAAITTANNNQQGTAHSFDRQTHCIGMVNSLVNVDLYSAIITKVSNELNMLVSGEKPGFQTLSKGLVVLLCAEVVR